MFVSVCHTPACMRTSQRECSRTAVTRAAQANGYSQPKPKAKPRVERNRVLVTGGAGFVGSHLCAFLVARGDHVSALDRCFRVHMSAEA